MCCETTHPKANDSLQSLLERLASTLSGKITRDQRLQRSHSAVFKRHQRFVGRAPQISAAEGQLRRQQIGLSCDLTREAAPDSQQCEVTIIKVRHETSEEHSSAFWVGVIRSYSLLFIFSLHLPLTALSSAHANNR